MRTEKHACRLPQRFAKWSTALDVVERALHEIPEADETRRDSLFSRAAKLEKLILATPNSHPTAIRAKAQIICSRMEMEAADALTAMREILAYLAADTD